IILFILGGAQGLIGWIMVDSGLNDTTLYVNHIKLSVHFISALVLLCYTLWFALKLLVPAKDVVADKSLHRFLIVSIALLTVQLVYGAFMAGLKAAMVAATWPTINGDWIPAGMGAHSWVNHPINVHFVHRGMAYILLIVVIVCFVRLRKLSREHVSASLRKSLKYPLILVCLQVLLGIFTVISAPKIVPGHFGLFEMLAESHQLVAMFLLMALTVQLYLVRAQKAGS
ncbi:MAG: heme A synthase, partial [Sphingobacteriales bacterium]